jgi:hypothetical protein
MFAVVSYGHDEYVALSSYIATKKHFYMVTAFTIVSLRPFIVNPASSGPPSNTGYVSLIGKKAAASQLRFHPLAKLQHDFTHIHQIPARQFLRFGKVGGVLFMCFNTNITIYYRSRIIRICATAVQNLCWTQHQFLISFKRTTRSQRTGSH